ncbi:MAG: ABC transporter permease [Blastocatellia bacterium]
MNTLWQDLRYGVRMLLKHPGSTVLAVLSLALGMMATTAIYSVIHAVVLDPFPYKDVDNLMSVKVQEPGQRGYRTYYSTDQFLEIAERSRIFEGVIASTISDVLWTDGAEPQRLRGNYGTPNTFQVMGVPPLLGRTIVPDDGSSSAAPVAVLGHRFWQRRGAADAGDRRADGARRKSGEHLRDGGAARLVVAARGHRVGVGRELAGRAVARRAALSGLGFRPAHLRRGFGDPAARRVASCLGTGAPCSANRPDHRLAARLMGKHAIPLSGPALMRAYIFPEDVCG